VPKYIFTYHQPQAYVPGADAKAMAAWQSFFEGIADRVGGYSVVDADDLDHAATLARDARALSTAAASKWDSSVSSRNV